LIELAKYNSCQDKYQKHIQSFLERSRDIESWNAFALGLFNFDSQKTTAAPTEPASPRPRQQDPIYWKFEELEYSEFGKVCKVIDVSTDKIYTGKYFYPDKQNK
jgi:hypothetical protein